MAYSLALGAIRCRKNGTFIKVRAYGKRGDWLWERYATWLWRLVNGPIPEGMWVRCVGAKGEDIHLHNLRLTSFGQEEATRMKNRQYAKRRKIAVLDGWGQSRVWARKNKMKEMGYESERYECQSCFYDSQVVIDRCPKCNNHSFIKVGVV